MRTRLLGMGAAAMDTLINCSALPQNDSFQIVGGEQLLPGGSCANMLVTFAALGGQAKLLAKIGDDAFGDPFRRTLLRDGVDDSLLFSKPGGTTLHTYIWAADGGAHAIMVNFGDSLMDWRAEDVNPAWLDDVDLFYSDLFPAKPALRLAQLCRERRIPVIICLECPPSFMRRTGVDQAEIEQALSLADLIVSGREGYGELTGAADYHLALAEIYRLYQPSLGAVCTAGEQGAAWLDGRGLIEAPAFPVQPLDSTGAGDSFLGALLFSYFGQGRERGAALSFATAVGAMKCQVLGPRLRPSVADVEAFLASHC